MVRTSYSTNFPLLARFGIWNTSLLDKLLFRLRNYEKTRHALLKINFREGKDKRN